MSIVCIVGSWGKVNLLWLWAGERKREEWQKLVGIPYRIGSTPDFLGWDPLANQIWKVFGSCWRKYRKYRLGCCIIFIVDTYVSLSRVWHSPLSSGKTQLRRALSGGDEFLDMHSVLSPLFTMPDSTLLCLADLCHIHISSRADVLGINPARQASISSQKTDFGSMVDSNSMTNTYLPRLSVILLLHTS
jgi:hypothetical protein